MIYLNVLNTLCSYTSYVNWIYYISWIFQNTCYTVYKGSLTKNSLRAPLVARKEVSSRKLMKGDCSTVLLFSFFQKKKILRSGGICIWIKKFRAGVTRYPFPGRDEADSFNGAIRAIYTREKKKRPPSLWTKKPWKSCELIHGKFTRFSMDFNAIFMGNLSWHVTLEKA